MTADRPLSISEVWAQASAWSREESTARRARVLAHDDLVALLRGAPVHMDDPARWSGWIPPRTMPEDACRWCDTDHRRHCTNNHGALANTSARRDALVAIAAEALRREKGEEPRTPQWARRDRRDPPPAQPELPPAAHVDGTGSDRYDPHDLDELPDDDEGGSWESD